MGQTMVAMQGTLGPDGTLVLDEKPEFVMVRRESEFSRSAVSGYSG